jgi:hypothetical protein
VDDGLERECPTLRTWCVLFGYIIRTIGAWAYFVVSLDWLCLCGLWMMCKQTMPCLTVEARCLFVPHLSQLVEGRRVKKSQEGRGSLEKEGHTMAPMTFRPGGVDWEILSKIESSAYR